MSSNRRPIPHVWHPKRRVGQVGPLSVAADLTQAITPVGASVTITPGTPTFAQNITPSGATVTITPGVPAFAQSITPTGATVTITPGTAAVSFGVPDPNPITLAIHSRGHTGTVKSDGHTQTIRGRGHTATVRERH